MQSQKDSSLFTRHSSGFRRISDKTSETLPDLKIFPKKRHGFQKEIRIPFILTATHHPKVLRGAGSHASIGLYSGYFVPDDRFQLLLSCFPWIVEIYFSMMSGKRIVVLFNI